VESDEGITTNILTDRLRKLEAHGIIHHRTRSIGWTKIHALADTKRSALIPKRFRSSVNPLSTVRRTRHCEIDMSNGPFLHS